MKFLFMCRDTYAYDFPLYAEALRKNHDVECHAIFISTKTEEVVKDRCPGAFSRTHNLDKYFHDNSEFADVGQDERMRWLSELEVRLGLPSLNLHLSIDRYASGYGPGEWSAKVYGSARFVEEVLATEEYDMVICEVGVMAEVILWLLAREKGIPCVFPNTARIKGRMVFKDGGTGDHIGFKESYAAYQKKQLDASDHEVFDSFRDSFEGRGIVPEFMRRKGLLFNTRVNLAYYAARRKYQNMSAYRFEPSDYSSVALLVLLRLRKFFNKSLLYPLKGVFSPMPESKYLYYPLHVDPEISTLLYGPFYTNQVATVEYLSKSIPAGYTLVVKDHPYNYGLRQASYYDMIRKLPNVCLVSPLVDNFDIIRKSEGVITVTGTAGFEAAMFNRPVFVLGDVFYKDYSAVNRVENMKYMAHDLKEGLSSFSSDNSDSLIRFVLAFLDSTYRGVVMNPVEYPWVREPQNVADVSSAMYEVYKYIQSRR